MKFNVFFWLVLAILASSVYGQNTADNLKNTVNDHLDYQGHRGCRGLMPENTIPGFIHALDLGVNTLEMDVVITKDEKVICSHEPWFSHEIALKEDGKEILESQEKDFLIYKMAYSETQKFDVGLKNHVRFPNQEKYAATKPLLSDVIDRVEQHAVKTGKPKPNYNIETKCTKATDSIFHPEPEKFSELLLSVLFEKNILERTIIQSFDNRILKYIHKKYPEVKLALLVETNLTAKQNLDELGFDPHIYSPEFTMVNKNLIAFCHERNIKVIPWTVNEITDMKRMISLKVDGLISDFPDRFKNL